MGALLKVVEIILKFISLYAKADSMGAIEALKMLFVPGYNEEPTTATPAATEEPTTVV